MPPCSALVLLIRRAGDIPTDIGAGVCEETDFEGSQCVDRSPRDPYSRPRCCSQSEPWAPVLVRTILALDFVTLGPAAQAMLVTCTAETFWCGCPRGHAPALSGQAAGWPRKAREVLREIGSVGTSSSFRAPSRWQAPRCALAADLRITLRCVWVSFPRGSPHDGTLSMRATLSPPQLGGLAGRSLRADILLERPLIARRTWCSLLRH